MMMSNTTREWRMGGRLAWATLSLGLSLGLLSARSFAQDAAKPAVVPVAPGATVKAEVKKEEAPKAAEPAKTEPAKAAEAAKPTEAPLPTIPPEVEAKLEAARRAVAEAIVAAQDAGLVETSIDPPPILDILITGRATDGRTVKKTGGTPPFAVSPEVLGAWFTGYGKVEGINHVKDVRIINPSAGLKQWYDDRARILNTHIAAVRKAKGPAPAAEPKKAEVKKEEPKPEAKKEEAKPEAKKEEPKPEAKKEEPKPEAKPEVKKEEPKKN